MKERCENPHCKDYKNYGNRGIAVCHRWENSFENFLADMGECPKGMTIERINNNKGYSPDNCRWATRKEQNNNSRNNRIIEFKGQKETLTRWSELTGIHFKTLHTRLRDGWKIEEALTIPTIKKKGISRVVASKKIPCYAAQ